MAISPGTKIKAAIIKSVIDQLTGGDAILEERADSIKIILSEAQKKWFQDFLDAQLEMRKKPDIEIDALGVILPVIAKRVLPALTIAGGAIAALIIGKGFTSER